MSLLDETKSNEAKAESDDLAHHQLQVAPLERAAVSLASVAENAQDCVGSTEARPREPWRAKSTKGSWLPGYMFSLFISFRVWVVYKYCTFSDVI